jgi:hypothetical protein
MYVSVWHILPSLTIAGTAAVPYGLSLLQLYHDRKLSTHQASRIAYVTAYEAWRKLGKDVEFCEDKDAYAANRRIVKMCEDFETMLRNGMTKRFGVRDELRLRSGRLKRFHRKLQRRWKRARCV